jgi:hypothetical protein
LRGARVSFLQIEDAKTAAGIANEGYGCRSQPHMWFGIIRKKVSKKPIPVPVTTRHGTPTQSLIDIAYTWS